MTTPPARDPIAAAHLRSWLEVAAGLALLITGAVITWRSYDQPVAGDYDYVVHYGPLCFGIVAALHGMFRLANYKSFVALRYLMVAQPKVTRRVKIMLLAGLFAQFALWVLVDSSSAAPFDPIRLIAGAIWLFVTVVVVAGVLRHSKPGLFTFIFGVFIAVMCAIGTALVDARLVPFLHLDTGQTAIVLVVLAITGLVGVVLACLALFFGCLRAFFTFFATVPIGGVWIGTAALVCVLAVMSGFESDLRQKILGSNAHIQVTREDGEFVDWREVKARIDQIPGVVASTPYATSEVVIAANSSGMNVIIKGIDPDTVGLVTDLVSDLDDREAIERLAPLSAGGRDRSVPQQPRRTDVVDPPPEDMPSGGEPIDFSHPGDGSAGDAPPEPYGGDAARIIDLTGEPPITAPRPVTTPRPARPPAPTATTPPAPTAPATTTPPAGDEPPADLVTSDSEPIDYSADAELDDLASEPAIPAIDVIEPTLSPRTQALPGILVGRELVKQTHLYTGEEVRVVSPLSDPSNPDATGTPIPFNRDYRVAGIFYTGMYEYDLKYVYVTLDSLQDFLDLGDAVDGIEIRIEDADDTFRYVPTAAGPGLLRDALGPGYRIQDWPEINRSLFSALKLEKIAMFLVIGIVILVASFSIVGNLIMVVEEKKREIALLKTLGASDLGVMQLLAIQGLMIGLIGSSLGVATGLLLCWAGKKFGLPLNPDVYYIDRLPIHVDPQAVAAAAAAGILISIAATLYPALRAARVRPAAGMRH